MKQAFIIILVLILLDFILAGLMVAIQQQNVNSLTSLIKHGSAIVIVKLIFGYYFILLIYFYLKHESLINFQISYGLLAVLITFFSSLTLMFLLGKWNNLFSGYREFLVYKMPFGNTGIIALYSSLLSPVLIKLLFRA